MDALHKAPRKLINENQVVCVESLKLKNMLRPPSLYRTISVASWSELVSQRQYEGEWARRSVVAIDQFSPTSKHCNGCGYTMPKIALNVRSWICPECGANRDRDVNATKNIKAVGLTALACGESVNPKTA